MTQPDEAYSIRELILRFSRGGDMQAMLKQEIYDSNPDLDNDDIEKITGLDLVEREELTEKYRMDAHERRQVLDKLKKEAADKKAAELLEQQEIKQFVKERKSLAAKGGKEKDQNDPLNGA